MQEAVEERTIPLHPNDPPNLHREAHRKEHLEWIRANRYNLRHEPRLDDFRGKKCLNIRFNFWTTLYLLRSFFSLLLRFNTLLVTSLSVVGTLICYYNNWTFDLPSTLIAASIVFPISFGIQFSINRRERVLLDIASLKSSALALYSLSKEWPPPGAKPDNLADPYINHLPDEHYIELQGTNEGDFCERMKQLLSDLLYEMTIYLGHRDSPQNSQIYTIYAKFDLLLHYIEEIRTSDEWIKSVISRAYQYVRYMMNDFERIRTVTDYRTPSVYRGYSFVMLTVFPILFSPSFAKIGYDHNQIFMSIYTALITSLLLVTLNNIMEDLEDPFDGVGVDDLNISVLTEPVLLMYKPQVKYVNKKEQLRVSQIFSFSNQRKDNLSKQKSLPDIRVKLNKKPEKLAKSENQDKSVVENLET